MTRGIKSRSGTPPTTIRLIWASLGLRAASGGAARASVRDAGPERERNGHESAVAPSAPESRGSRPPGKKFRPCGYRRRDPLRRLRAGCEFARANALQERAPSAGGIAGGRAR